MKKTALLLLFLMSINAKAWDTTDFKSESLSPFITSARNILYYGGGLTLAVLIFEDAIVDPTQK
jgi:hypothetical protein